MVDLFLIYQFIRRLVTPFSEWEAYKLGIIDERGNVLKKRRELRRQEERRAFGVFDVLVLNLKKLLERLPAGQTRIASYAAALWLIREHKAFTSESLLTESCSDEFIESAAASFFYSYTDYTMLNESVKQKASSLDELFEKRFVDEDSPTVSVGAGAIAGLTKDDLPGLTRAQQKKHKKKNKILKRKVFDENYKVIDKETKKELASFKLKALADRHYHVQQGWADVITDDKSITK